MKFLFLLMTFPVLCFADEYVWKEECNNSQRSMNICSGEMLDFYDKELNRLYSIQMNHIQSDDRKKLLKEAQLAWINFRDKDCLYSVSKREKSGSIWPATHNSCLSERTKSRIKELRTYVACRDNGCPN